MWLQDAALKGANSRKLKTPTFRARGGNQRGPWKISTRVPVIKLVPMWTIEIVVGRGTRNCGTVGNKSEPNSPLCCAREEREGILESSCSRPRHGLALATVIALAMAK